MFRRLMMALGSATTLALVAACASVSAPAPITDTVARTPQLTTLGRLIGDADLADTLRAPGPYTVFAPSDDAFKALPPGELARLSGNKEALRALLTYHVLPGRTGSEQVQTASVKTVQGATLALSKAGSFVTVEDAVVQTPDIAASNGVVHVIDRVLMPPKR